MTMIDHINDDDDDDGDNNGLVDAHMLQFSFITRSNFISRYLWTWSHDDYLSLNKTKKS